MIQRQSQPKIFGIGFSKTGTTTLNVALRLLGYETLLARFQNWPPVDPFDALTHEPVAHYFESLDQGYPGGKFICTVRDRKSWLKSIRAHLDRERQELLSSAKGEQAETLHWYIFDKLAIPDNKKDLLCAYDAHLHKVQTYFAGRETDVLFLDICGGEGWERLCPFLDLPIPDIPFPHEHKIENTSRQLQQMQTWKRVKPFIKPVMPEFLRTWLKRRIMPDF